MRFISHDDNNKIFDDEYSMVVFLHYLNTHPQHETRFQPSYFRDELNINDAKALINKLIKQKFIEKDKDGFIALLPKAQELLSQKKDYIDFFNLASPYVTISEYKKAKKYSKDMTTFQNVMLSLLINKIDKFRKSDDYIAVKNINFDVATLYEQIPNKSRALYHYLTSLYYEVSGLEYYDSFLDYIQGKCTAKDLRERYDYVYIDPGILYAIAGLKELYSDELVDDIYIKNSININLCTIDKFKQLVSSITGGNFQNNIWQKYFWKAFNSLISTADKYKNHPI